MERESLLITGMNEQEFVKAMENGNARLCYSCGRAHGDTCVAIINKKNAKCGTVQVEEIPLSAQGDELDVSMLICKECLMFLTAFGKATARCVLKNEKSKNNEAGLRNRLN